MKILAIETSCDETSIAVIGISGSKKRPRFRVLSHLVATQIELHAAFGGVVPNLAKREHQRLLVPLLLRALKEAGLYCPPLSFQRKPESRPSVFVKRLDSRFRGNDRIGNVLIQSKELLARESELFVEFEKKIFPLAIPDIDAIAVTNGPGLAPALWVGINFAKALSLLWKKPIIPMNHMKGHLYAAFIQDAVKVSQEIRFPAVRFPAIALLVSGGHTELVLMKRFGSYQIIGETQDDAAGEAFDKVARMLKLGYPGGPAIATEAANSQQPTAKIKLPRPMMNSNNFNFSFSGLKTAVLYTLRDLPKKISIVSVRPAIAKEFQDAVVDVLAAKTIRAAKQYGARTIAVGGGVSANQLLRKRLAQEVSKLENVSLYMPDHSLTGDNALMIALAAAIDGKKKAPKSIGAEANMRVDH